MNEMTDLEKQLDSWTPRHPSAALEERLFGPAPAPAKPFGGWFSLAWQAPALPVMLVFCLMASQRGGMQLSAGEGSGSFTGLILSNRSATAWLSPAAGNQNILANTFEWTNAQGFSSSVRSLSAPKAVN